MATIRIVLVSILVLYSLISLGKTFRVGDYEYSTVKKSLYTNEGRVTDLLEVSKNLCLFSGLLDSMSKISSVARTGSKSEIVSIFTFRYSSDVNASQMFHKVKIYPFYYLDPNERVECKIKKYREQWLENKLRYPKKVSVVIISLY